MVILVAKMLSRIIDFLLNWVTNVLLELIVLNIKYGFNINVNLGGIR